MSNLIDNPSYTSTDYWVQDDSSLSRLVVRVREREKERLRRQWELEKRVAGFLGGGVLDSETVQSLMRRSEQEQYSVHLRRGNEEPAQGNS